MRYESRAGIVKALACPARLMIVDELAEFGERSVQELTAMIGTDASTVSRHLSTLKNAGVIT
ncbi:MAG: winged helix-turn-helix transcriptional regulator, partial [Pirellulales bacterium]|nr:winged helix-turn-helix transcriptional regulator [Pirellulales bacterium]